MADYSEQIANAAASIAAKGAAVTWRRIPDGTVADASKPWVVTDTAPVEYPVFIVFLPLGTIGRETLRAMAKSEVPEGDIYALMAAGSFTPSLKDVVIRGSQTLRVLYLDTLKPADQPILHMIVFAQ